MTLSTNIYVLDPVSPHELFRFCQTLLTKYDEERRPFNRQKCSDVPLHEIWKRPGAWNISNEIGQGLPAILDIKYRPNAPLTTPEQSEQCTDDCDKPGEGDYHYHPRTCYLDIDFDTAYGYKGPDGMGCGDLHAALVSEVGQWLDTRNVRWEWHNEFTGEIHGGEERYARLVDLCSGGFEATAWFTHTVMPAIESGVIAEGGAR